MSARIKLFTFFYNEGFLVPFYLSHYWWADSIHAIVSQSQDRTRELLAQHPRVVIEDFEFPNGKIDDGIKRDLLNQRLSETTVDQFDWLVVCDADEFFWPKGCIGHDARPLLAQVPCTDTVIMVRMWDVYRHATDSDLDPEKTTVVLQRRHGVVDRSSGRCIHYQKPMLIRPGYGLQTDVGCHGLLVNKDIHVSRFVCDGAHWWNADPCFAVNRRVRDRSQRISEKNFKHGWGNGQYHLTDQKVLDELKRHENDPLCF